MKGLLLNKNASVKKRLRLFDACVGSCVLWGTRSWTPRVDELRKLRTAQNMMLRRIAGPSRRPDETWVDWIVRSAHRSRRMAEEAHVRDWVYTHAKYKWAWAGHVARRPCTSWLWQVSTWRDSYWNELMLQDGGVRPMRPSRRRWMKWEDALRRYCVEECLGTWGDMAAQKTRWLEEADRFASWMVESIN